ncbi:MAG: biopolymer transporter ExbD, partial [Akkermansiaceae bacterium]|nr:biopolymer transporter ExbD [Akkermansiaceae bacterium]
LARKSREADKVVVVKSAPDTAYDQWIRVSQAIDDAGGILTLELASERTITID